MFKESFEKYGSDSLDDSCLISIILGEEVYNVLKNNGLNTLFKIDIKSDDELRDIGISKDNILRIKALISLCRRGTRIETVKKLDDASIIAGLCNDLVNLDQEILRVICVNKHLQMIYQEDVYKGSLDESIVHPREVLKVALKCSAYYFFIVHNHPAGDLNPSKADILITDLIKESGKILKINLLDHIIVSKKGYISFKEKDLI